MQEIHTPLPPDSDNVVYDFVHGSGIPLERLDAYDPLIEAIGDKPIVMLGKESHGTAEYYREMANISKRLIQERGYSYIAIEWDYPTTNVINRFVTGKSSRSTSAEDVLSRMGRFPEWMFGNEEFLEFVTWLRNYNEERREKGRTDLVEVYGLDMQMREPHNALFYVQQMTAEFSSSPRGKQLTRSLSWEERIALFDEQLETIRDSYIKRYGEAEYFSLLRSVDTAYARFDSPWKDPESWDHREEHMYQTIRAIQAHKGESSKGIVWASIMHSGDSKYVYTEQEYPISLARLLKRRNGESSAALVGMGTYEGTVVSGSSWEWPISSVQTVFPAHEGSWQDVFFRSRPDDDFLIVFDARSQIDPVLRYPRNQRVIGAVYQSDWSDSYDPTDIVKRFDAFVFLSRTHAVSPILPLSE